MKVSINAASDELAYGEYFLFVDCLHNHPKIKEKCETIVNKGSDGVDGEMCILDVDSIDNIVKLVDYCGKITVERDLSGNINIVLCDEVEKEKKC